MAAALQDNNEYLALEMRHLHDHLAGYLMIRQESRGFDAEQGLLAAVMERRQSLIEERRQAVAAGVDIPFEGLSHRYGLTPYDEEVLLACLAAHLSATNRHLLLRAQAAHSGSVRKAQLDVGFLADFALGPRGLLSPRLPFEPDGPLVTHGLVVLEPPSDVSGPATLLAHEITAPHYVAAAVIGRRVVDERLQGLCELVEPRAELFDVILSGDTRQGVDDFITSFAKRQGGLDAGARSWTLLVSGPRRSGKTTLAEALARSFRKPLFTVHLDRFARRPRAEGLLFLAARNAAFDGAVFHLVQPEALSALEPGAVGSLLGLVQQYPGITIVEPHAADRLDSAFEALIDFPIEIDRTDADDRVQLWESLMPAEVGLATDVNLAHLASAYGLTGGQIRAAIEWAWQRAESRGETSVLTHEDLEAGAKSQLRSKISQLTDASRVRLVLDDLILPEEPMKLVHEFLDACRYRLRVLNEWGFGKRLITGKGLVALFTGEAGTGKTLCAEILAHELDLRLRIVSIPQVVSKWVGETEKNIRELFTHARAQNTMLLFDEADSLFGTRVKVEKSQDQFQNMEVNMLLQEIERFEGIVILTTNLEANIDRAFERRILFKLEFPAPQQAERERIWKTLLPKQTPLEDELDFGLLAEVFDLTGGQIKNAIIRAAYRCFAQGHGLSQHALEESSQQQARAAGKLTRPLPDRH